MIKLQVGTYQTVRSRPKIENRLALADPALGRLIDAVVARLGPQRIAPSRAAPFEALVRAVVYSEVALQLGYLNSALEGRPYILGNDLTAADIQLSFIGELAAARFGVSAYPNVERWIKTTATKLGRLAGRTFAELKKRAKEPRE